MPHRERLTVYIPSDLVTKFKALARKHRRKPGSMMEVILAERFGELDPSTDKKPTSKS